MNDLTAASHETFMLYAEDAGNWSGNPWVSEGNIEPTKAQRGNLSDLVKKGLIEIVDFEPGTYIKFTPTASPTPPPTASTSPGLGPDMTAREIQYRVGEGGARVLWYPEDCALEAWGPKYQERTLHGFKDRGFSCIACGKTTGKSKRLGVFVTGGGGVIIHRDDIEMEVETAGFMGWYPVGSECIKVVPEEFRVENPFPVKP